MTTSRPNLDPVESLLREFDDAARAGVFRDSRVDPDAILRPAVLPMPIWVSWIRKPRVAWSLAAMLALAATVWTWMIRTELRSIGYRRDELALITRERERLSESVARSDGRRFSADCMTGPANEADDPCNDSDLVADRHIDLRDFGLLQRTLERR